MARELALCRNLVRGEGSSGSAHWREGPERQGLGLLSPCMAGPPGTGRPVSVSVPCGSRSPCKVASLMCRFVNGVISNGAEATKGVFR